MPASMMIACVAFSPNVTGSRMEIPASGPMPGSTPTRVPTRQPRKAYQALLGSSATEKPWARLTRVVSTRARLDAQHAGVERGLQHINEQRVSDDDHADAVDRRRHDLFALYQHEQAEDQQNVGDEKAEPVEQQNCGRCNPDH